MNPQITYFLLLICLFAMAGCDAHGEQQQTQSEQSRQEQTPIKKSPTENPVVSTGATVLIEEHLEELKGFRVGLVMNPTARIGDVHMLDTLLALDVNVTALYAPEHGFRGEAGDGEIIENGADSATGLPVYSLYGETRKPTGQMLEEVDLLLFDMQDVGARFYTYNATLGLLLESASEHGVEVWLLDRPNPAGGEYVSGWIMEDEHMSFVGKYPVPVAHGMTLGELGLMMIGEGWIQTEQTPDFRVIKMQGWDRSMIWPQTGLQWVPPSPNLPTFEHAYVYLGTCLVEGTTLSEGRGTDNPFLMLGSPGTHFTDSELDSLRQQIPGARLQRARFTPREIPGRALNPKHEGEASDGVRIVVTDYNLYDPVNSGLHIMTFLMRHTDGGEIIPYLYQLTGSNNTDKLEELLQTNRPDNEQMVPGRSEEELYDSHQADRNRHDDIWWEFDTEGFEKSREQYLLY